MKYKIEIDTCRSLPKTGGHGEKMKWKKVATGEVYIGLEKVNIKPDKWHPKERIEDFWLMIAVKTDKGVKIIHEDELE